MIDDFGAVGYGLVSGLYALLTLLLLTGWRGTRTGIYLITACLISALWAGVLAVQTARGAFHPLTLFVVEVLRSGAWIVFLTRLLGEIGASRTMRYLAHFVWLGLLFVGLAVWIAYSMYGANGEIGAVLIPGGLATALVGLVLIEQLYRNSPVEARWSLKLLVLGLGGMFA